MGIKEKLAARKEEKKFEASLKGLSEAEKTILRIRRQTDSHIEFQQKISEHMQKDQREYVERELKRSEENIERMKKVQADLGYNPDKIKKTQESSPSQDEEEADFVVESDGTVYTKDEYAKKPKDGKPDK